MEIRARFLQKSWVHRVFFSEMCEPIFSMCCKHNYFYIDADYCTFSTRRIDPTFKTFGENCAQRYPGYLLT